MPSSAGMEKTRTMDRDRESRRREKDSAVIGQGGQCRDRTGREGGREDGSSQRKESREACAGGG